MAATKTKRKPITMQHRHGFLTHRDAIWAAIRALKKFTYLDIEQKVNVRTDVKQDLVSTDTIRTYVKRLTLGKYLELIKGEKSDTDIHSRYIRKRWHLINDIGIDAPRLDKEGNESKQGEVRKQLWNAMKILKEFNWHDLVATAATGSTIIKELDVKDYIKHLKKAGYIRLVKPGNKVEPSRFRFIPARNTGPLPPMVQRVKQVFDPNLGEVVWPKGNES